MSSRPRTSQRRRVLVVDDDPLVRDLLAAVLHDTRFVLDTANDGVEALVKAQRHPPDVVILDVMMPGANGYEVCRRLRSDAATAGAHIVILTARNTREDMAEAMAAGADAFFTKPFSPLDLISTVTGVRDGAA